MSAINLSCNRTEFIHRSSVQSSIRFVVLEAESKTTYSIVDLGITFES
uniref:Uncharacterized protein n=1 Tax=Arundo donax TaxID=35708 RepID=A0A0A8ZVF9_ARUDO